MNSKEFFINNEFPGGIRIDKYLALQSIGLTRSQFKQRITSLQINGKAAKPSRKVFPGDRIAICYADPPEIALQPERIPLVILYEDENVIVVNKPQGMVVHPGAGNYSGTLVNALLACYSGLEANFMHTGLRPGIVHRLDKDTSGVIITAKNVNAHEELSCQFRNGRVRKTYYAVIKGVLARQEDTIDIPLRRDPHHRKKFCTSLSGGKRAVTRYRLLKSSGGCSLVELKPKTGRTHQLRVHMKHIGSPVLGDPLYSRVDALFPAVTLMLHAYRLVIRLPGETQARKFTAPLPARFRDFFRQMQWEDIVD